MDVLLTVTIIIITLIFLVIIGYSAYEIFYHNARNKYQTIYFLNHPFYNRGHKTNRNSGHCPRGCASDGTCIGGQFCFNSYGKTPHCCSYDEQCKGCVAK
jgi:hypothetical protein